MRKIFLFMMISVDGYFEGPDHDLSWHNVDDEFNEFAIKQMREIDLLLFGRRTYQLMEGFWPNAVKDPKTSKEDLVVAQLMDDLPKVVFSRKGIKTDWNNVRVVTDNVAEEITKLKEQPGKDIAVFGSSNLCVSLIQMELLDEIRIMVNSVTIGNGTTLFQGLNDKLNLKLINTKEFKSGNVLLFYKTVKT